MFFLKKESYKRQLKLHCFPLSFVLDLVLPVPSCLFKKALFVDQYPGLKCSCEIGCLVGYSVCFNRKWGVVSIQGLELKDKNY